MQASCLFLFLATGRQRARKYLLNFITISIKEKRKGKRYHLPVSTIIRRIKKMGPRHPRISVQVTITPEEDQLF